MSRVVEKFSLAIWIKFSYQTDIRLSDLPFWIQNRVDNSTEIRLGSGQVKAIRIVWCRNYSFENAIYDVDYFLRIASTGIHSLRTQIFSKSSINWFEKRTVSHPFRGRMFIILLFLFHSNVRCGLPSLVLP